MNASRTETKSDGSKQPLQKYILIQQKVKEQQFATHQNDVEKHSDTVNCRHVCFLWRNLRMNDEETRTNEELGVGRLRGYVVRS